MRGAVFGEEAVTLINRGSRGRFAPSATPQERLQKNINRAAGQGPNGDCYEWIGPRNDTGYGSFWINGHRHGAHRVAWESQCGPIPKGMLVCHHCDNPACCRVDHLFLGDHSDNGIDASRKGRVISPLKNRTHCKRGHPLSGDNLQKPWPAHPHYRICLACRRERHEQTLRLKCSDVVQK